jgi:hypothetical protein
MVRSIAFMFVALFASGAALGAEQAGVDTIQDLSAPHYLQKAWRYSYDDKDGSRREFAQPGYDDGAWQSADLPYSSFKFDKSQSRFVWFRKRFTISKELEGRLIGLHTGKFPNVAQVYINGVMIGMAGNLPPHPYDSNTSVPYSFFIPDGVINYGGENLVAYKMYCELFYARRQRSKGFGGEIEHPDQAERGAPGRLPGYQGDRLEGLGFRGRASPEHLRGDLQRGGAGPLQRVDPHEREKPGLHHGDQRQDHLPDPLLIR